MAIYNNSVQTDKGRVLETRSRNGEGTIEFVCIKTGAGIYSDEERLRLREMTDLKEMKQEFRFSGIKPEKEYDYLLLESVIKNEGMEEGYYFTEVGIYARIRGEEENVLYCIGLVDEPDYIPPHTNGKTYEIVLQSLIKCYDAEHITIEYADTVYATAESLMEHISDKNNPHDMTAEQLALGNVDNTSDIDKPVSIAQQAAIDAAKEQLKAAIDAHVADKNDPHNTTKEQVGLGNADNTADIDKPVSTAQQAALDDLYQQLTAYTQAKIAELINGAPTSMDTLKEVSDAIAAHKSVMDALDEAIGKKANAAEFDSHTKDITKHITAAERNAWNGKQAAIIGGASTIATSNLTASRALVSDGSGKVAASAVTATELGFLAGLKSKVQDQLNELNTGLTDLSMSTISIRNEADLIASLNDITTKDYEWYRRYYCIAVAVKIWGGYGGDWYVEGVRSSSDYEWQIATSYISHTKRFMRSKNNGVWGDWIDVYVPRSEVDSRLKFVDYGIYDHTNLQLNIDAVVKSVYNKLPFGVSSGRFIYACHYYIIAEKASSDFGSMILFSYNVNGVITYSYEAGRFYRCSTTWTKTEF